MNLKIIILVLTMGFIVLAYKVEKLSSELKRLQMIVMKQKPPRMLENERMMEERPALPPTKPNQLPENIPVEKKVENPIPINNVEEPMMESTQMPQLPEMPINNRGGNPLSHIFSDVSEGFSAETDTSIMQGNNITNLDLQPLSEDSTSESSEHNNFSYDCDSEDSKKEITKIITSHNEKSEDVYEAIGTEENDEEITQIMEKKENFNENELKDKKFDELVEIAEGLSIPAYKDVNGKKRKKTKKELCSEIVDTKEKNNLV